MRNLVLGAFALAAVAVAGAGCSSVDQFDVPLSAEGTIPGSLSGVADSYRGFAALGAAGGNVSQQIDNQGVSESDLTSVKLTTATLAVGEGSSGNLSYLTKFEIWVSAPGLDKKRLAHQEDPNFQGQPKKVALQLDDVELKPYVAAKQMTLEPKVELYNGQRPAQDLPLKVDLNMHVDLSLVK